MIGVLIPEKKGRRILIKEEEEEWPGNCLLCVVQTSNSRVESY